VFSREMRKSCFLVSGQGQVYGMAKPATAILA
jgi:hypothetical protein